ncbi:LLM class flavin-dependent oxidoreductase [Tatumella saanichensis]|uniref:LLM class flavin-dependent oxidoreductase n=1 Tax=Tatumella saanichensis TaxID=480813 RepID=UPI0004A302DA|nr:LLM class flavin-dependent oxidoreductase [Tatumella saanichensis]
MSVQFIGMISHRLASETIAPSGPVFNRDYITRIARAHEHAGFDRLLVAHASDQPDGFLVTALAGLSTEKIKFLLAHRPGFVSPTLAARKFATLHQLLDNRLAVHIISGGSDAEQRRDGDYLDHDQRYARSDAFLDVVRQVWQSEKPFDIDNDFYRAEQAVSAIRPAAEQPIPVFFGGSSEAAIRVAGKHADVYALWGESLAQTRETIERVRAEAARHGRNVEFSVSFRPIIADTEQAAWQKAEQILATATERQRVSGPLKPDSKPQSVGAQRLRETAALGDVVDKRLWTGIARLVGGGQNSTSLVGTPDQVADALLDYYDLGVRNFLIRGFDPLNDALDYGKELLPLTREKVARREQAALKRA